MDSTMQAHFDEFEKQEKAKSMMQQVHDNQNGQDTKQKKEDEEQQQEESMPKEEESMPKEEESVPKDKEECLKYKTLGNEHFKKGETNQALDMYDEAVARCPSDETSTLAILFSNMSLCYDKHQDHEGVVEYTSKAIKCNPTYLKPLLNRAEKYVHLQRYDEAVQDYDTILQLDPNNRQYLIRKQAVTKLRDDHFEKQKKEAMDGLKGLANTVLGKFNMSLDNFQMTQGPNGGYNIQFKQ